MTAFIDPSQFATPRNGGWFYSFPNGVEVLVLPRQEAMRFTTRLWLKVECVHRFTDDLNALRPERSNASATEVEVMLDELLALTSKES